MKFTLNPEAEEKLKRILEKDENDLTPSDIGFLKARRSYIGKNSQKRLARFLDNEETTVNNDTVTVVDAKPEDYDHPANLTPQEQAQQNSEPVVTQEPSDDGDEE